MSGDVVLEELEKTGREWLEEIRLETMKNDDKIKARQRFRICPTTMRMMTCIMLCDVAEQLINFGAFVDIGVHQDGLVHISQLANTYVKDPNDVVKLHQHVMVRVLEVDLRRHRISLTMRK